MKTFLSVLSIIGWAGITAKKTENLLTKPKNTPHINNLQYLNAFKNQFI